MVQRTDFGKEGRTVLEFPTHAAVALSGKGLNAKGLGNALMARSHVVAMRKALKGDVQEEFDDRHHLQLFKQLGSKLLRLCIDNESAFANYDRRGKSPLPDHLNRPQFARHFSAIQNGNRRSDYEQQTIYRRI